MADWQDRWWLLPGEQLQLPGARRLTFEFDDGTTWGFRLDDPDGTVVHPLYDHSSGSVQLAEPDSDISLEEVHAHIQQLMTPHRSDWQLRPADQVTLDAIARTLRSREWATGRSIRVELGIDKAAFSRRMNRLCPRYLRADKQRSEDFCSVTLPGLLRSSSGPDAKRVIEAALRVMREKFSSDPDASEYTLDEVVDAGEFSRDDRRFIIEVISMAGLLHGGSGGGSGDKIVYSWGIPPDEIEDFARCRSLDDLLALAREGKGRQRAWLTAPARLDAVKSPAGGAELPPIARATGASSSGVAPPQTAAKPQKVDAAKRVGDWRLLDEDLGEGGQGKVVLVWNEKRFCRGALKRPRADKALTEKAKERFLREIRVFESTNHPFILKVLDAGQDDASELYLVTEVARFGSLRDNAPVFAGDALRTLRLARDVAIGLAAVHENKVVHRDLKPANLLLYSLDHPLVGDFGIAHLGDHEGVTSLGEKVGSFGFAPREYEMKAEPTPAFDVFSLGAIVHWTLSGGGVLEEPYRVMRGRPSLADRGAAPWLKALDRLLDRMLDPDAGSRPQSMHDVVGEIDRILGAVLALGGIGNECVFCGRGTYRDLGAVRLGSNTEINFLESDDKPIALPALSPRALVCDNCGEVRWRSGARPSFTKL